MCYLTFICHELDDQRNVHDCDDVNNSNIDELDHWCNVRSVFRRLTTLVWTDLKKWYRQRVSQLQVSRICPNDAHKASSESINIPSSFSDNNYNNMQVFLQLDKSMLFVFRRNQITLQSVSMLSLHFSMHFLNNKRHLFNRWAQKSSNTRWCEGTNGSSWSRMSAFDDHL